MTTPINIKELQEHMASRVNLSKEFDGMRPYMMHMHQTVVMLLRMLEKMSAQLIELDNKIVRTKVELVQLIERQKVDNKGDPRE